MLHHARAWIARSIVLSITLAAGTALAQTPPATGGAPAPWLHLLEPLYENLGSLILAAVAIWLAYRALRANTEVDKRRLDFEEKKFCAEEEERKKLAKFREQEYKRFSQPAVDLAKHLAKILTDDPHWAHRALEAAKLLPNSDTRFGERSQHFRAEKEELARCFTPYLLQRCREIITKQNRDVYLLIDAGTTLYPFFEIIGRETVKHQGEDWLKRFHLATNNLPGIEELIKSGRRTPWDRYSKLAIDDCRLLPGIPVPIFSAVAGDLTNEAIRNLRNGAVRDEKSATFIALLAGNWIRIRSSYPRCPVPMARGKNHREVKQTLVENADEIFVVTPLGKVFTDCSNAQVNEALGFSSSSPGPEDDPYEEVKITDEQAATVRIVTTKRPEGRILHRHSNRVEDALCPETHPQLSEAEFASRPFTELPHMLFPFDKLPASRIEERNIEFPHSHTRENQAFLALVGLREP